MAEQSNHFDPCGNAVMVDVSEKASTLRIAVAGGRIHMNEAAFSAVCAGAVQKGDVLGVARLAGIMAVKQTPHLIPLCHPLLTEKASVDFTMDDATRTISVTCTVQTQSKTGVEMEALCGVNIALLTIYDMCKALDKGMEIVGIRLLEKRGGKSGHFKCEDTPHD